MASAVDQGEVVSESPPKSGGKRKLILIAAPIVLIVLLAVTAWLFGLFPHHHHSAAAARQGAADEHPTYVELPDIIANLDSGTHRAVFVKVKARIVLAHAVDQPGITAAMPQILDAFQTYLRSMRPDEIDGGEGTYRLREALINQIDTIVTPVQVTDLLFVELLVQ